MRNKKQKNFIWVKTAVFSAIVLCAAGAIWYFNGAPIIPQTVEFPDTKYGDFLAGQHAVYVNDFESAGKFYGKLSDVDLETVRGNAALALFLAGKIDDGAKMFRTESAISARLAYAAWLAKNGDWAELNARFKNVDAGIFAPLRVWSSVAVGNDLAAIKFIDSSAAVDDWKKFARGSIYAQTGDANAAKKQFESINVNFLNLNDYAYLISFYKKHGFDDAAKNLNSEFTSQPGGLFMSGYGDFPDFSEYLGFGNQLAFSMIQTVSHNAAVGSTDMGLVLLRIAEAAMNGSGVESPALREKLNYYLGAYFYSSGGDCKKYWDTIGSDSPYHPFVLMKYAEKAGDFDQSIQKLKDVVRANPLFIMGIQKLVAKNMQNGRQYDALRVLNNALDQSDLNDLGRAYLLRSRAHVYLMFGDIKRAQADITAASDILPHDAGILLEQARIWAATGENLDRAYEYVMALAKMRSSDLEVWDTIAQIVRQKEGDEAAMEVLGKVSRVAESNSALFEHLGDILVASGDLIGARAAYYKSIDLSDDGLVIVPNLREKIKGLK